MNFCVVVLEVSMCNANRLILVAPSLLETFHRPVTMEPLHETKVGSRCSCNGHLCLHIKILLNATKMTTTTMLSRLTTGKLLASSLMNTSYIKYQHDHVIQSAPIPAVGLHLTFFLPVGWSRERSSVQAMSETMNTNKYI